MVRNQPKHLLLTVILAAVLFLSGCGAVVLEGASVMVSDKTASDHLVSWFSGKDCSVVRSDKGLEYCVEDQPPMIKPNVYCYRTLASVSCYTQPDPRRSPDQLVGQYEYNLGH